MRFFITIIVLLFAFVAQAQTVKASVKVSTPTATKEYKPNVVVTADGNFVAAPKETAISTATLTDKTYTDSKGEVHPVYVTKKGKYFVKKVSSKTGKEYAYYLKLPGEPK